MDPTRVAFTLLVLALGSAVADYEVQPVDAVLYIDGAPTYLRLTNSTTLENVYNCVLENSKNVNSVILAAQLRGVQLDVGQLEENANDAIRRLSTNAARTGRTLWKSPEELQMFKTRLARYLTMNYYDSKPFTDPETYINYKSQRSADWLHSGSHRSNPNFHPYQRWSEAQFATSEPRRHHLTPEVRYEIPISSTTRMSTQSSTIGTWNGHVSQTPSPASNIPQKITEKTNGNSSEAELVHPNVQEVTTEGVVGKVEDVSTEIPVKIPDAPEVKQFEFFATGNDTKIEPVSTESTNGTSLEDGGSRSSEEMDHENGDGQKKKRRKGKKKNVKKSTRKGRKRRRPGLDE